MSGKTYWFARRFPLGDPRKAVSPISWQGYAVAGGFVAGMMLSGALYLAFAAARQATFGMAVFALGGVLSLVLFIVVSRRTADMTRTVDDYKAGRAP